MEIIRSSSNDKIKLLRKLYDKKWRREYGLYPVEGINIISSIPRDEEVNSIYVSESAKDKVSDYLRLNCPVYYVDDNVFDKAVETVTPSGAVALIRIRRLEPAKPQNNALILDRISDPGNLGAIIRTAASAGYPDIYMINCADAYSGKVVRASMGGIFRVKLYDIELSEVNELFKGISVIALDADGDSIYNIKSIQDRYALIIGNEASGISDCLMEQADRIISLPMSNGMESLNAAVAAGAAMYYLGGLNYVRP